MGRNIAGTHKGGEQLPRSYRFGVSAVALRALVLAADIEYKEDPSGTGWHDAAFIGCEYKLASGISLRAGLRAGAPAAGFGFHGQNGVSVDYAFDAHELGGSHRISLGYNF
jgi:hypothetical protein